jgi:hypothetical protein
MRYEIQRDFVTQLHHSPEIPSKIPPSNVGLDQSTAATKTETEQCLGPAVYREYF